MTLTLNSRLEDVMAAPTDSQVANPFEGASSRWANLTESVVESIELKGARAAFGDRTVLNPDQKRRAELERAERQGLIDQERRLTAVAPDSAVAFARLAQVLALAGDKMQAAVAAREALTLAQSGLGTGSLDTPPVVMARFIAARVLAATGEASEAEVALEQLPPTGPWRGVLASLAAERGDVGVALERLEENRDGASESFRGYLLLALNRPQEAMTALRAAMRAGDDSPALWANLAFAHATLGSPLKAIRAARRAADLAPCDRQLAFSLASYLRQSGQPAEAVGVLLDLEARRGHGDPRIAAAIAHAHVACGEVNEGLRVLRRAQHHNALEADSPQLAELNANYAALQWRAGQIDRSSVLQVLRRQIQLAGPTLDLVRMLADFGGAEAETAREVAVLRDQLAESPTAENLADIDIRLALLRGQLDEATRLAVDHAESNPLDVDAIVHAIYLRAFVAGDYSEAANMGLRALRRMPAHQMLINNTAFALAWAGRADEAGRVLQTLADRDDPYVVATRGLVLIALGAVQAGVAQYDKAADLIGSSVPLGETEDFLLLLRANEALALTHFAASEPDVPPELRQIGVPVGRQQEPRFAPLAIAARRTGTRWDLKDGLDDSG